MEAGLAAQAFGVPFAIISGGIGCVVMTGAVIKRYPQLWAFDGEDHIQDALDKKLVPAVVK